MNRPIKISQDVYDIVHSLVEDSEEEMLLELTLNGCNRLKSIKLLTTGSDTATVISPKQVCRQALMDNARGIILVHNHPSGNVAPSTEDIKGTEKCKKALETMDIPLLDHLIIGNGKYFSFSDNKEYKV